MRVFYAALVAGLLLSSSSAQVQPQTQGTAPAATPRAGFFSTYQPIEVTVEAPFDDLTARARQNPDYAVEGKVAFMDAGGKRVTMEHVQVSTRGHTSLRESECDFPKLKLDFSQASNVQGSPFAGLKQLKIGTHCSSRPDGQSGKYGRWANDKATHREAFVYRLLDVMKVPTLKARPARITYIATRNGAAGGQTPVARAAMFLEDEDDAIKRYGAAQEMDPKKFGSAKTTFKMPDVARLAFAQAMIGNFDWCLRMTPEDTYRCNDTTPLWNILWLTKADGSAVPVMYDFDLAGAVTMRHTWFSKRFNPAFARSEAEVEAVSQVQHTRTMFPRDLLDATRAEFVSHKADAYATLNDSMMDDEGRAGAKAYLDAFFAAIETDEAFYRPVVTTPNARIFIDAARSQPVCGSGSIPVGTPVGAALETSGDMSKVIVLDALWHFNERCDIVRASPVWIATGAIGKDYPSSGRSTSAR
jgi:hypothetical protein